MKRANAWTALKDEMPPVDIGVVFTDGDVIASGCLKSRDTVYSDDAEIRLDRPAVGRKWLTHWMLPELPDASHETT